MSGKPWDNINQNVNLNIDVDTGYKLLWIIGAIFIGVGAVWDIDRLYSSGWKVLKLGLLVYFYYLVKYNREISKFMKSMKHKLSHTLDKYNKSECPNNRASSKSIWDQTRKKTKWPRK